MAVAACFGGVLAVVQRRRVRGLYEVEGGLGDDCVKGCCCCCCVLAQNEREVEGREERRRRYAGPASTASTAIGSQGYARGQGMVYAPPPR